MIKGESLMNNNDQMIILSERQAEKIKFLQAHKDKSQKYIKNLKQCLQNHKLSLQILASKSQNNIIAELSKNNKRLMQINDSYYQQILTYEAKILIEQQLRNQQKKMYHERLQEFENTMSQLRKFLQDKQDSFSTIVNKLKKYQQLNELTLANKLQKFRRQIRENCFQDFIREISEERDKYKQLFKKTELEMSDLIFLKQCLNKNRNYEQMREVYRKYLARKQLNKSPNKFESDRYKIFDKNKSTLASSVQLNASESQIIPNKELIRLLKKQKLNNQILQGVILQAIEKNQELVEEINQLIVSNNQFQQKVQKLQSKIILLEQYISQYQNYLKPKTQWKSKCDMYKPSIPIQQPINASGDQAQIHMESLKYDVEKISTFLATSIPTRKLQKSLSSHDMCGIKKKVQRDILDNEIEIEQIY